MEADNNDTIIFASTITKIVSIKSVLDVLSTFLDMAYSTTAGHFPHSVLKPQPLPHSLEVLKRKR
jgi:hypothetical protein